MEIQFTTQVFKEGRTYVAHARELDVSSCGGTEERALKNLKEAVRLFPTRFYRAYTGAGVFNVGGA